MLTASIIKVVHVLKEFPLETTDEFKADLCEYLSQCEFKFFISGDYHDSVNGENLDLNFCQI